MKDSFVTSLPTIVRGMNVMKRQNRLSKISTILLLIAAGLFILSLFFPWWRMDFFAPQYPEGLDIIVYPDEVTGDIDIINNLNHYIGMKEFNTESFPELKFLKYIVYVFVVLTLIVAFTRNKLYLYILTALLAIGGAVGLIDMHFWLKEYGTNLDPNAAMYLDPFVPPIIGKKQIANFTTYSKFGLGGYILGVIFIIFFVFICVEHYKKNETKKD